MGQDWFGVIVGSGLAVMGVRTLNGWQKHTFKRPRVGGWSLVTSGAGMAAGSLLALAGVLDRIGEAGWLPFVLVLAGLVLFFGSGPGTRFGRRRGRG